MGLRSVSDMTVATPSRGQHIPHNLYYPLLNMTIKIIQIKSNEISIHSYESIYENCATTVS